MRRGEGKLLLQTLNTRRRERKKIADCVVSRLCLENGKGIVNKKRIKKISFLFAEFVSSRSGI